VAHSVFATSGNESPDQPRREFGLLSKAAIAGSNFRRVPTISHLSCKAIPPDGRPRRHSAGAELLFLNLVGHSDLHGS
jgi:hypothetical protein